MLGRTNTGGGGAGGFGLQIVEGLERPKNPTQGMIWAKTEHKVTYYDLSATKPENPVDGTLWVSIVDSGQRKIVSPVSKEWITVYLLSAKQYVSGAWVNVTAMSYQGGEWTQFSTTWNGGLFDNGDQFEAITGGWARNSKLYFEYSGKNTGTVEVGNIIKLKAPANACAVATTVNKIDLTEFNTLQATETEKDGLYVIVHSITSGDLQDNYIATSGKVQSGTANIDITAVTGEYYISAATWNGRNAYIPKISLLK